MSDVARRYAQWGTEVAFASGEFASADLVAAIAAADGIKRERFRIRGSDLKLVFTDGREIAFPAGSGTFARLEDLTAGVTDHGALTGLGDDDHTQYHNDARADAWLATKTTAHVAEGSNLYFTNARADTRADLRIAAASINDLSDVAGVSAITGETGSGAIARAVDPDFSGSVDVTGGGTGTLKLAEWASSNAYLAAGFAGSVAAGSYNLMSSPGDTNFYLNAPTSREIRFRINDATQMALAAGSLDPATAGSTSLGRAGLGWNGLYLDSSSTANSIAIVGGAAGSNITLTTPTSTGTLALTSDIAATVTQAFVNALNVDADTLDGLDSTDFALVGHNHTGVYQPLDAQLTDLAGLSYASNALKVVRVNAAETGWELATPGAGYTDEEAQDAVGAMVNGTLVYTDGTPELGVDPTLAITSLTLSSLTAGRVPIVSTAGLLADDAGLLYDATTDQLTSGIFKQGANNAGGFYGTPTSGTNDYRLFVNSSNEWELRTNQGGVANAAYKFGTTAFYPVGPEDLGLTGTRWGAGYFSGLVRASSLNLTLGGTELALPTDGVLMLTSRAAAGNNAVFGMNSGSSGVRRMSMFSDGTEVSRLEFGSTGWAMYPDFGTDADMIFGASRSSDEFYFTGRDSNRVLSLFGPLASAGFENTARLGPATNLTFQELSSTPVAPAAGSEIRMYMKANKIVFVYDDAGTVRYKYLDMTGTGVTWVHTTSAP